MRAFLGLGDDYVLLALYGVVDSGGGFKLEPYRDWKDVVEVLAQELGGEYGAGGGLVRRDSDKANTLIGLTQPLKAVPCDGASVLHQSKRIDVIFLDGSVS